MRLFKEDGETANFADIARFMMETYPPDVFISGQNIMQECIFKVRDACQKLLQELKRWEAQT